MAFLSLARKYRPKRFADVAVQQHVANTLKGAIARDRVAHAYLLCGPRGTGKTTLARVLAMALNCERKRADGEPCGECASCTRIWSGSTSLDVVEIDAASNRGVEDARQLRERASYAPGAEGGYRVYIVDEAHMLTKEAWNTLLKILEEPPPHVVFVFATTEAQKIAQTASPVLSRMQRFDFKRIGPADVRERLTAVLAAEQVRSEPEALTMLARAADGSMRDALSLADQALSLGDGTLSAARVREALGLVAEDEYLAMLDIVLERRAKDVFPAVARLVDAGVDLNLFLAGFADVLRALLAVQLGGEASDFSEQARSAIAARKDALGYADVLRMLTALTELEPRFRRSAQQQVLLETALVRFALQDHSVAIEDVLTALGNNPAGGGGSVARDIARPAPKPAPSPAAPHARSATAPHAAPSLPAPPPNAELSVPALVGAWDAIVQRMSADGRSLFVAALKHAVPVVVTAKGEITLELEPDHSIYEPPITQAAAKILDAIRAQFPQASKVGVRVATTGTADASPKRITAEHVKAERLASLRKKDPALDAAVEDLDLELLD